MILSPNEQALLLALRGGRHFKANPAEAKLLLKTSSEEANPVARQLIALGLARRVPDSDRPGAMILRLSDAGMSEADKIRAANRKPTRTERLKAIPIGKGVWDLIKIGLAFASGVISQKYFGK